MARSRKNKKGQRVKTKEKALSSFNLMVFFVIGLFLFFVAYIEGEHLWNFLHNIFLGLFGSVALVVGPFGVCIAVFYAVKSEKPLFLRKIYEIAVLLIIICAIIQTYDFEIYGAQKLNFFERLNHLKPAWINGLSATGGGAVGEFIGLICSCFLGRQVTILILWVLIVVLMFLITGISFAKFVQFLFNPLKNVKINLNETKSSEEANLNSEKRENYENQGLKFEKSSNLFAEKFNSKNFDDSVNNEPEKIELVNFKPKTAETNEVGVEQVNAVDSSDDYVYPSIGLLNNPPVENNVDVSVELKSNAARLVDTLKSFGVETRIIHISRGPSVTRYELQPSAGVKISKITNLADDISLNLASGGVRIEAPIPNKAAVGIEVPNKKKETVFLREIVSSEVFMKAKSPLTFALGKDIAGNVVVADIAKMPHVLIAGATGSGKSVCINSLIVSLLYKSSPKNVRLLLIDPKVVELGVYNNVAHLLIPVVTDPKKAAGALNWAVNEMLKRYKLFAQAGVRDLKSYNTLIESGSLKSADSFAKLPQIVIIIDELADLMMAASKEVENSICRLAQMARAAGMHLVIATQRPSVDVITGLIKANVPSRIAFTVSSQIDSRTIIDLAGAEKLLGKGDMLYFPVSEQKPIRVQGCFLTDGEVERVVNVVKVDETSTGVYGEEILEEIERHVEKSEEKKGFDESERGSSNNDPLFVEAVELVLNSGQASTSFLQRKLKLGYSRAARIIDEMESAGIVGQSVGGGRPRKVLMSRQQFLEMKLNRGE